MGRHSAPDDDGTDADDADDAATLTLIWDAASAGGRHAAAQDAEPLRDVPDVPHVPDVPDVPDVHDVTADEQATIVIPLDRAVLEGPRERVDRTAAAGQGRADRKAAAKRARTERKRARAERKRAAWERGSRADLRMLRQNIAVRVQCIAVIAIAFGGYTAVMFELGRDSRSYLLWVWVPIVISGVLVGACLDLAHRRAAKRSASAEPAAGESDDSQQP